MQLVINKFLSDMDRGQEITTKFKSFGDEKSTLLDQYERLSFEVQLNQAMLGRSLSSPATARRLPPPPPLVAKPVRQGKRGHQSSFQKMIKKLFRPILGNKVSRKDASAADRKDPTTFLKAFSRSLRV